MKKTVYYFLLIFFLPFISCYDPIFYHISLEEKLLDPMIPGSPTNFEIFRGKMYVASGMDLFRYDGGVQKDRGNWKKHELRQRIFMLASTGSDLFIVCEGNNGGKILKKSIDPESDDPELNKFSDIGTSGYIIFSIYSINNEIFMGALSANNSGEIIVNGIKGSFHVIRAVKDEDGDKYEFKSLANTGSRLLNGAEYNGTYFFSTKDISESGGSVYSSDLAVTKPIYNNIPFMGLINLGSTIAAISENGVLYDVGIEPASETITEIAKYPPGDFLATGSLSIYENGNTRLLLAGRQDKINATVSSGYTFGYLEIELDGGNIKTGAEFREPGNIGSTTMPGENGKFRSSIGKFPLSHIIQSPVINGSERILFASTQKNGVWSYRERKGSDSEFSWYWNAEQ